MWRSGLVSVVVACVSGLSAGAALPAGGWVALDHAPEKAPADNPLKGFFPFSGEYDTFPHSMEFDYVGLASLMDGPDRFTFDGGLEPLLNEIASRGHQAVIRVYLDYPDEPSAVPQFLIDGGLGGTAYDGSSGAGWSPDYDDPALETALEAFIAAFGARYDGDPRIGFVQLGLLGHWGEWHTYPEEALFASVETQNRVLAAYDAAFDTTKLLVSHDVLGHDPVAALAAREVGFHDDDFTNSTLPTEDYHFWSRMMAAGFDDRWRSLPIGGEVQPDFQAVVFDSPSGAPEDFAACVMTTHASWLLYHEAFEGEDGGDNGWSDAKVARAIAGARATGYEFFVAQVNLPDGAEGEPLTFGVRVENRGVAPFYYAWPIRLIAVDEGGEETVLPAPDWDLTEVIPGAAAREWIYESSAHGLAPGEYTLRLTVPNPLAGGAPVRFANATETGNGVELGTISVGDGGGGMPGCGTVPGGRGGLGTGLWMIAVAGMLMWRATTKVGG